MLLVDDARETVDSFRVLLELHGATVLSAYSGREALEIAAEQPIDLLLSDLGMPEIDGYQLIRELRRMPLHQHVPAIALSGFGRPSDVREALAQGTKPVPVDRLLQAMQRLRPAGAVHRQRSRTAAP